MIDREKMIDIAMRVLRDLNNGREPYAPSVLPMARALEQMARDPEFVLAAAEALLREAGVDRVDFFCSPFAHGDRVAQVHSDSKSDYGRSLVEACAARKQREGGEHG